MFHEYEIVLWSCLADPSIFRTLSPNTDSLSDPTRHLLHTALCVKRGLTRSLDKEVSTYVDNFIGTLLLDSAKEANCPKTSTTAFTASTSSGNTLLQHKTWLSVNVKSLLKLTPQVVNDRYNELRAVVRNEVRLFERGSCKKGGYVGHDYNGIVNQLN